VLMASVEQSGRHLIATSYTSHNCGWPNVEGGVEVAIKVCSNAVESVRGSVGPVLDIIPACRT
jgi:hypothetical protein